VISHIASAHERDKVAVTLSDGVLHCAVENIEQAPPNEH